MNNPTEYIRTLIQSFPVLRRKLGHDYPQGREFDARDFAGRFGGASTSEYAAAVFVLSVWAGSDRTELGEFKLVEAIGTWDSENRAAFAQWVQNPKWP